MGLGEVNLDKRKRFASDTIKGFVQQEWDASMTTSASNVENLAMGCTYVTESQGGRNGGPQQQPAPSTSAISVNNTNQANNVRSGQSATSNNN